MKTEETTGLKKFEVVLAGGEKDGDMTLYILAPDEQKAAGYSQELADSLGYDTVALSSEEEYLRRKSTGMVGYQFSFPTDENSILTEAPPVGNGIPTVVLVVQESTVAHLFDESVRKQAERKKMLEVRAKRIAAAGPIVDKK